MSEKSKNVNCPVCGAEIPVNEDKEQKHGISELLKSWLGIEEQEPKSSEKEEVNENVLQSVSISPIKKTVGETLKEALSHRLINRLVAVIISVLMLALMFTPFVNVTVEPEYGADYELKFSGINALQLSTVSSILVNENILSDDIFGENGMSVTTENLKQDVILNAMSEKLGMTGFSLIASALFLAYAILCIVLLIVSVRNLFNELVSVIKKLPEAERHSSDGVLCMLLCLLPAVCFFLIQTFRVCTKNYFYETLLTVKASPAWGATISIIIAFLGTVFICGANLVSQLSKNRRYFNGKRLRSMVCGILVIFVMISLFLPCLSIEVWKYESVNKLNVSVTDITSITEYELRQFGFVTVDSELTGIIDGSFKSGDEKADAGISFLTVLLLGSGVETAISLYDGVTSVTGLMLIFIGFWLWIMIRRSFFGVDKFKMVNTFKVFTLLFSILNLVNITAITHIGSMCLNLYTPYYAEINLGIGVIMTFVFTLLAVILRLNPKNLTDGDDADAYDNADTSYAPYVIDQKR